MLVPESPFLHLQVAQVSALLYRACIDIKKKKVKKGKMMKSIMLLQNNKSARTFFIP